MITLLMVLFMGQQHEGVILGKLPNSKKWQAFFNRESEKKWDE